MGAATGPEEPELLEDGQEEVFSKTAVELGMAEDPKALDPALTGVEDGRAEGYVLGWKLDPEQRRVLLDRLTPAYPDVVADHVTLKSRVGPDAVPPAAPIQAAIVGDADDGAGVQAMVVSIDGATDRPGGGTYHITWSLDRRRDRKAVESNAVIAARGWSARTPIPITLRPECWPR